jgi:hypothetical protein
VSTSATISPEKISSPPIEHGSSMEGGMMKIKQETVPPLPSFSIVIDSEGLEQKREVLEQGTGWRGDRG